MHQVHHIFLTVTHFITKYFKTIFINIIINVLGSNQAHGIRYKFCKIIIFALKLKFYHWHQKLSGYFPRRTGPLCSFSRKYLLNPQIRISLSVILSSNNGVSWEKGKKALSSACWSNKCTKYFPLSRGPHFTSSWGQCSLTPAAVNTVLLDTDTLLRLRAVWLLSAMVARPTSLLGAGLGGAQLKIWLALYRRSLPMPALDRHQNQNFSM